MKRITDFIFSIKSLKPVRGISEEFSRFIVENEAEFRSCMNDDFNISGALGVFFECIHYFNLYMSKLKLGDIENILSYIDRINSVLGVIEKDETDSLDEQIMSKIEIREKARRDKDFQLADKIRDELKSRGIMLIDTPDGVRWKLEKE